MAKNPDGLLVEATKAITGFCPLCGEQLIAKCGTVTVWHWSHRANTDCDSFGEPESEWHQAWKRRFGLRHCEQVIGCHRADVQIGDTVIEIQHSPISASELDEREVYYTSSCEQSMVWIFDADDFVRNLNLRPRYDRFGKLYFSFRWKRPYKTLWQSHAPIFLDLRTGWIFEIKRLYASLPCGGWGYLHKDDGSDRIVRTIIDSARRYTDITDHSFFRRADDRI